MKKRICAAALAGTMLLGPTAAAADAAQIPAWLDVGGTGSTSAQTTQTAGSAGAYPPGTTWNADGTPNFPAGTVWNSDGSLTGPDGNRYTPYQNTVPTMSQAEITAYLRAQDPELAAVEVLTYAAVEPLVRQNNLTVLSNRETLAGIEAVDIDEAIDDLEDMIDDLEDAVDGFEELSDDIMDTMGDPKELSGALGALAGMGGMMSALIPYQAALGAGTVASLQNQIATLKAQIGQLEDQIETLENTDYEPYERQFENIEDQIVMGAQTAYIGLATMQQNYVLLLQQIDLLGIKVNEMKTRYKMGQVSDLDVAEVEAAKLEADSGLETLKLSVRNTKGDLNLLLGRPASQGFLLDGLPELDTAQLAALNLERDLASGKRASDDIYKAEQALEDAKDLDKSDDGRKNKIRAAEYTLSSTEQSFEQSFRKLFRDVAEKNRLVTVAKQNQTLEARKLAVAETKYNRGMISRNDLIEAQLDKAKVDTDVKLAQVNLFAAYMQYEWAVKGVLSSASAAMK